MDEIDPIPTDPDGAMCFLLAYCEAREMIRTAVLPTPSMN